MIRLADTYDAGKLERACRRALDHASPYYRTVKTLLAARPDLLDRATSIDGRVVYLHGARFARSARSLFPEPTAHSTTEGDCP